MISLFKLTLLQRYILRQFLTTLLISIFAATAVFWIFDFFEHMRVFIRENAKVIDALNYLIFKIPLIIHLMTPVAMLIATLITIGRLSQLSEITAMRACGVSILEIAKPLMLAGLAMSGIMLLTGETLVPWATQRVEDVYQLDIRKKHESGTFSKANFWYRDGRRFLNIGLYDSRQAILQDLSIFNINKIFDFRRRIDAQYTTWEGPNIGWTMHSVTENIIDDQGMFRSQSFPKLPLIIDEKPEDFYNMKRSAETMSYSALKKYIKKLSSEGVPVIKYQVELNSKLSFPLVNFIVVIIAFPFALTPARSGSLTKSFIAGVTIGFGFHFVHALSTSLGAAELIPIIPAAWAATILLGSIGGYLMSGAEYS